MLQLFLFFLKVGAFSFGKMTATHSIYKEYVERRARMNKEEFFTLNGFLRLFPGPTQTQTSIALGNLEYGWKGGFLAGFAYVLPSLGLITLSAFLYFEAKSAFPFGTLMRGINIISLSLLVHSVFGLAQKSVNSLFAFSVLCGAAALTHMGVELPFILGGAGGASALFHWKEMPPFKQRLHAFDPLSISALAFIFFFFLKIGLLIYGGGLVMIPFIRQEMIDTLGWLTPQEFLTGFAVGQATPGPVILTVAFFGYKAALSAGILGLWGALLAGLGILLPSFLLILSLGHFFPKLKELQWLGLILQSLMPASAGSVAAASLPFFTEILLTPFAWFSMVFGVVMLSLGKMPSWLLILGYGAAGFILPPNFFIH